MLRISNVTEYTEKFLFSLLIECLVRLLWFDRSALRLSRLVKCQSLFQCEQNRPPLSFWLVLEPKLFGGFCRRRPTRFAEIV